MKNIYMITDSIKNDIKANLSPDRYKHTENVICEAVKLAEKNGADVEKARFVALVHDRFRDVDDRTLNELIIKYKLDSRYMNNNALAHGLLAAEYYKDKFGIVDAEVLDSVKYHTTGRYGMGVLEKIIFLADAIEKDRCYDGVEDIRKEAAKGLDNGVKASLESTVNYLRKCGQHIDKNTLEAIKYMEV